MHLFPKTMSTNACTAVWIASVYISTNFRLDGIVYLHLKKIEFEEHMTASFTH